MSVAFDTLFFRSLAVATGLGLGALAPADAAPVSVNVTFSSISLPPVAGAINGIDLTGKVGQTSFTVNSGANAVAVTTQGGAVVQGSLGGQYAAPVAGGTASNPVYYTAPYLSTGGTPNTVTLSFASSQSYLGLLWGSIGSGDYISFRDSANVEVGRVTGTQAQAAAAGYNSASGAQGYGGSEYTLINLVGGQFDKVVLGQTGDPSFEAGNFEYSAQAVAASAVPEPTSMALAGLALAGCFVVRRKA